MISPQRRTRTYPVLLPEDLAPPRPRRRAGRTHPLGRGVALAAVFLVPLLGHVWLEATAAQSGYRIRHLRSEIAALAEQNAHLETRAAALRSPDRIERLATGRLGMRAPQGADLAAVAVSAQALQPAAPRAAAHRSVWQRLATVFLQRAASAQEPRR